MHDTSTNEGDVVSTTGAHLPLSHPNTIHATPHMFTGIRDVSQKALTPAKAEASNPQSIGHGFKFRHLVEAEVDLIRTAFPGFIEEAP